MTSETALAVVATGEQRPVKSEGVGALWQRATDVAGVCREIVLRTAMQLGKRRYVKVEGWESIAAAYGCSPTIVSVEETPDGVRAVAELRRHDGTVLSSAEGFCGTDEAEWSAKPRYARRGMAQTRAIGRVCRGVFAFVVTLIDADLSTTPAEEMPMRGEPAGEVVDAQTRSSDRADFAGERAAQGERSKRTLVKYGKARGKHLCDTDEAELAWLMAAGEKSVAANDPKWHAANVAWLELVRAEADRRK